MNENKDTQTTIDEVHEIMFLLRGKDALTDGDFRAKHLGSILSILREEKQGNLKVVLSILTLRIGLTLRKLKEDYITGLINMGILSLEENCNTWHWVGISAIRNKYGELRRNTPEDNEYITESLSEHAKKKPHCKNCQKLIPVGNTFCSKECIEEYKKKEGKEE